MTKWDQTRPTGKAAQEQICQGKPRRVGDSTFLRTAIAETYFFHLPLDELGQENGRFFFAEITLHEIGFSTDSSKRSASAIYKCMEGCEEARGERTGLARADGPAVQLDDWDDFSRRAGQEALVCGENIVAS